MDEIYKRWDNDCEKEIEGTSEIQDFFAGQTVFLTGCTGFLGKIIVEKLLRSCWDIKKLYVLVRPKKQSTDERMKKYFDDVIFDRLKVENPNFRSKITTLEGNLSEEDVGLSVKDYARVIDETTVIYHNASNVKFDEKIGTAIKVNVIGTSYMLRMAEQCKNLQAFVYISTAYSHCYKQHIEEKFYPPPANMKLISDILAADAASPSGMDEETFKGIRDKWPNNYVFTKSTAEGLVEEFAKKVAFSCSVFRPSMVISTYKEPIRGWCGNINGPVGATVGTGIGFIHAVYKGYHPIDYVPVDMCANALLAMTWDTVVNREIANEQGTVYNYGSSTANPLPLADFEIKCFDRGQNIPTVRMMGPYYTTYTNSLLRYWFLHLTYHLITALFADAVLLCRGEKPQALMFWRLLTKNMNSLHYFANGNWRIHVHRMQRVWDRMNPRDDQLFFCDLRKLDWGDYCFAYWAGLRVYILKDPMETVPAGLKLFDRLILVDKILHTLLRFVFLYYLAKWLYPIAMKCF